MQVSNYVDIRNKVFSVRETKRKSKNLSKKKKKNPTGLHCYNVIFEL